MPLRSRALRSLRFAVRPDVLAHHLGLLLIPLGLLSVVPAAVAALTGPWRPAATMLAVAAALALSGDVARRLGRRADLQRNEGLVLTAAVFVVASAGGAISLAAYGLRPLDAWFEASSGSTTTGLSMLATREGAPTGLLFLRAWLQWVGGLGVLVLALALIVTPGASARRMGFDAREMADVAGGTRGHSRRILAVYASLTTIGVAALWLLGIGPRDAVLHAFTAVSTGGFATSDDSIAHWSRAAQAALLAICLAGAVPFSCYQKGVYSQPLRLLADRRVGALLLLCATAAGMLVAVQLARPETAAARSGGAPEWIDLVWTAISAQTTTGFASTPIASFSAGEKLVVIGSMFVGGGVGSTAGGIKVFRWLIFARLLWLLLDRASIVRGGKICLQVGRERISSDEVDSVVAVVTAYVGLIALSWLAFLLYGYAPIDALFEVVSAVGTVGLSTGLTSAHLPAVLKVVLSLDMLMGRVEVIAFLVLIRPSTWIARRREV